MCLDRTLEEQKMESQDVLSLMPKKLRIVEHHRMWESQEDIVNPQEWKADIVKDWVICSDEFLRFLEAEMRNRKLGPEPCDCREGSGEK